MSYVTMALIMKSFPIVISTHATKPSQFSLTTCIPAFIYAAATCRRTLLLMICTTRIAHANEMLKYCSLS